MKQFCSFVLITFGMYLAFTSYKQRRDRTCKQIFSLLICAPLWGSFSKVNILRRYKKIPLLRKNTNISRLQMMPVN